MKMNGSIVQRTLFRRYFVLLCVLFAGLPSCLMGYLYFFEIKKSVSKLKAEEMLRVVYENTMITNFLEDIVSDLRYLSQQKMLYTYLQRPDPEHARDLAKEYLAFCRQKKKYDQIRFIDASGAEKIRVDFRNKNPLIVPDDQLQNKGHRYYFRQSIALPEGSTYMSPLDLNVENNQIEIPHKPMIRFGFPVFDAAHKKQGIIVFNYLAQRMMTHLEDASKTFQGNLMLINQNSFWLFSPNKKDEWGFMFKQKEDRKFSKDFPDAWSRIILMEKGQLQNENGIFSFVTAKLKIDISCPDSFLWKMISWVSPHQIHQLKREYLFKYGYLILIFFVISIFFSWILATAIVKLKDHQHQLYVSAHYDNLTRLPNRVLFMDRLKQTIKKAIRNRTQFGMLFIDLDGFKTINDEMGHDAGDTLLSAVSQRFVACVRESDTVARLGGDEFIIIVDNTHQQQDAVFVSRKILEAMESEFRIQDKKVKVGASIGISFYPTHGQTPDELIKKADDAMYQAKQNGKNCLHIAK